MREIRADFDGSVGREVCVSVDNGDSFQSITLTQEEARLLGERLVELSKMDRGKPARWVMNGQRSPARKRLL